MGYCPQPTITDVAFEHLKGINRLSLCGCTQLTSAVFTNLKGIKWLDISRCPQLTPTDDSLKGIERLGMSGHSQAQVQKARSLGYPVKY